MNRKWMLPALLLMLVNGVTSTAHAQFGRFFQSRPPVNEISTTQLHEMITVQTEAEAKARENGEKPPTPSFILVDVRSPQEFGVSMIPGAITRQQYEAQRQAYAGRTVIPYCTIGGRSSEYAQQLASKGVKVLNYKESILGWCRHRMPLTTTTGAPTRQVHTYSSRYQVPSIYQVVN